IGALLCFGLRFMAIRYGWRLPTAIARDNENDSNADQNS
ncbi:MAG: trimeric intracellular cation channel family protein, partial [Gammaproteobacteria bacterium]|nr:trimeric intracellular cation channel family protein [Gammaproteobacteria bacterium]